MASTVWKGHLTFGLVSVPVRFVRAARAEKVRLRQLHVPRSAPAEEPPEVRTERERPAAAGAVGRPELVERAAPEAPAAVAPVRRTYQPAEPAEDSAPIDRSDLVKGYEYAKGQYVVLEDREIRELMPATATELPIVGFVHFVEIDPIYLETSYYVIPAENGEKAYALLYAAMRATGYAAIGQLTMHRRDHVVILRPGKSGLIAHTMFYPDEVRTIEEFRTDTTQAGGKELDLAKTLIQALAGPFEPEQFQNTFRARLQELIDAKIAGREITPVAAPAQEQVIDIMDALRKSLAQVKPQARRKPAAAEAPQKKGARKRSR